MPVPTKLPPRSDVIGVLAGDERHLGTVGFAEVSVERVGYQVVPDKRKPRFELPFGKGGDVHAFISVVDPQPSLRSLRWHRIKPRSLQSDLSRQAIFVPVSPYRAAELPHSDFA